MVCIYVKCVPGGTTERVGVFVVATPEDGVGAVVLAVRWVVVDVV